MRAGYLRRQEPANRYREAFLNSTISFPSLPVADAIRPANTRILNPEGAAEFLGIEVRTVTRWARKGYLPAHPLGEGKRKFWRFYRHELDAWLAARTNQREAA